MRRRAIIARVAVVALMAVGLLMPAGPASLVAARVQAAGGQTTPAGPGASGWTAPRTPWGDPDLQGTWSNITATSFERPEELAGKAALTEEEAAAYEQQLADQRLAAESVSHTGYSPRVWFERGDGLVAGRTSLVVDPPDGRVPPLTPEAARKAEAAATARSEHPADSWEDVSLYTRCLTRGMPGAMVPGFYNHNYQILQTPDHVAILVEMIHDVRIIPLDGRPHLGAQNGQWLGDSRGRWEGETLVVETTSFAPGADYTGAGFANLRANYPGSGATLRLIERFTRVGVDAVDYEFTVVDPGIWTRPWTASIPMSREGADDPIPIYEYACHEGNYGIVGILAGHRAEERAAADGTATEAGRRD